MSFIPIYGPTIERNSDADWHDSVTTTMSDLKKGKRRQFVSLPSQDDITAVEHPNVNDPSSISKIDGQRGSDTDVASSNSESAPLDLNPLAVHGRLRRGLSARQVQMIAIAGE